MRVILQVLNMQYFSEGLGLDIEKTHLYVRGVMSYFTQANKCGICE
jgi:hypothetical protein